MIWFLIREKRLNRSIPYLDSKIKLKFLRLHLITFIYIYCNVIFRVMGVRDDTRKRNSMLRTPNLNSI